MILIACSFVKNFKVIIRLSIIFISVFLNAQEVEIWSKSLKTNVVIHQKVDDDIIKRTFVGNNIVGDRLYFKKSKNKYYFKTLKEFEQKSE